MSVTKTTIPITTLIMSPNSFPFDKRISKHDTSPLNPTNKIKINNIPKDLTNIINQSFIKFAMSVISTSFHYKMPFFRLFDIILNKSLQIT